MSHPNPHYDPENSLREDTRGSGLLKPKKKYSLKQMSNIPASKHYFEKFGLPKSIANHPLKAKSAALNKAKQ